MIAVTVLAVVALLLWRPEWFERLRASLPAEIAKPGNTIYKWQDGQGNWHASNRPPPEGTSYRALEYDPEVNVLPLPQKLLERD